MAARYRTLKSEVLAGFRALFFESLEQARAETAKLLERQKEAPTLKHFEEHLSPTWKRKVKGVFVLPFSGTPPCLVGSTRTLA